MIIKFIAIFMMRHLPCSKGAFQLFFKHKNVLKHISLAICSGMLWFKDSLISLFCDIEPTTACPITFMRTILPGRIFWFKCPGTMLAIFCYRNFIRPRFLVLNFHRNPEKGLLFSIFTLMFYRTKISFQNTRRRLMEMLSAIITRHVIFATLPAIDDRGSVFKRNQPPFLPCTITSRIAKIIFLWFIPIYQNSFLTMRTPCLNFHDINILYDFKVFINTYHFEFKEVA